MSQVAALDAVQTVRRARGGARRSPTSRVADAARAQHVATLLNTSADVLAAAGAGEHVRMLSLTEAFMATSQVRAAVRPTAPRHA